MAAKSRSVIFLRSRNWFGSPLRISAPSALPEGTTATREDAEATDDSVRAGKLISFPRQTETTVSNHANMGALLRGSILSTPSNTESLRPRIDSLYRAI